MGLKKISMSEHEERAKAQLMMVEQIYALKITNHDEAAKLIAENVDNEKQVLTICTSLNSVGSSEHEKKGMLLYRTKRSGGFLKQRSGRKDMHKGIEYHRFIKLVCPFQN